MERKGTLIRSVDRLDISDEAKRIACELTDRIEMPVVFLIDHDLDKQYAIRSMAHHNQFWVLANHMDEQSEYERVILSNIYRGIQTRKRFLHPVPAREYIQRLTAIEDAETKRKRQELYFELLGKISAFVSTVDAEMYFKPKGVELSAAQKRWLYDNRIKILDEYLELQKAHKGFRWYKELECINAIDYARIASFDESCKTGIFNRLKRISPQAASKRCISRVSALIGMIDEAHRRYGESCGENAGAWMVMETVRILGIEKDLELKREYARTGSFVMENNECADVYSFVPTGFDDEDTMVRTLRHMNEGIVLFQEFTAALSDKEIPDVHVNLIRSGHINAYANKLSSEYYISVTSGLLKKALHCARDCTEKVPSEVAAAFSASEIESRLTRYALFYIGMHEYAHILNGDCERTENYRPTINFSDKKEALADEKAKNALSRLLFMQYRPDGRSDLISRIREFSLNMKADPVLLDIACDWCDGLRC